MRTSVLEVENLVRNYRKSVIKESEKVIYGNIFYFLSVILWP